MRRWLTMVLAAVLLLSLCGCKSKAAKETDELILRIGEVTASSSDEVEQAQNAYDALSDREKEQVENYAVLEQAQKDLAEAKRTRAISEFEKFVKNNPYAAPDESEPYALDAELLEKYAEKLAELREMGVTEEECPAIAYGDLVSEIGQYGKYEDLAKTVLTVYPRLSSAIEYETQSYIEGTTSISVYGELRYKGYSSATEYIQMAIDEINAGLDEIDGKVDMNGYGVQTIVAEARRALDIYDDLLEAYSDCYYEKDFSALKDILSDRSGNGFFSEECKAIEAEFSEKNTEFGELLTRLDEKYAELFD